MPRDTKQCAVAQAYIVEATDPIRGPMVHTCRVSDKRSGKNPAEGAGLVAILGSNPEE